MSGNLEKVAYDKIKVAISKGYIKKGDKLKEVSLSKSLNMSRATVKGAFKRLVYEGLAEHEPYKGVSVVNPSPEYIKESYQVRAQLEEMATILAAKKLGSKDFNSLHKLIQEEEEVFKARALDQYHKINSAFHLKIAEKSGNRVLIHYIRELLQKTNIYLILFDPFYQLQDTSNPSPREHQIIVQYLEKKEGKKAGLEMKKHLESTMNSIDLKKVLPNDYLTV
ncbi:MAG: GntR family transcriptional regulator [Desulfobacteraceae bacterium]|nr:GntR family transcriptional regulator [Desulfobacteraceae bacterium]